VSDVPSLLSGLVGNSEPPFMTDDHSPKCRDSNEGTLMCCENEVNGGNEAVQFLASLAHYKLTNDTINGVYCELNLGFG
jgi:hypothetical protein